MTGVLSTIAALALVSVLQPAPRDSTAPIIVAVRARGEIRADGRLEESAWDAAIPATSFTQRDPDAGAPATERTEVRIVYDAAAVYVGARLSDTNGQVSSRLGRRDSSLPGSDWFTVSLDSYHDHLTGFRFSVNPDGVRRDEKLSADDEDESWDPVWQAAATRDAQGWTVEMRIPLSQLRFRNEDEQVWGIQLEREIARNNEVSWFAFTPKRERAGIARFGHLTGLRGLVPRGRLELLPYAVTRARYHTPERDGDVTFANPYIDGSDQSATMGLDLKYRLASNITVDATVNPDFGQVEVDPAVVNLTAFETRFEERRPFFDEGAEIFSFGGSELFYSRRIGARPPGRPPASAVYDDTPEHSTILAAAKLSGKARGWSLAVLDGVTGRERASYITADAQRGSARVAPLANYLVGRVRREMREGESVLGGIVTAVHRDLSDSALAARVRSAAYAGGVDFTHEWSDRTWSLSGFAAGSYITGSRAVITSAQRSSARYYQRPDATHLRLDSLDTSLGGFAGRLQLRRQAGLHWRGDVTLGTTSPGYEINDLGFQSRADEHFAGVNVEYVHEQPGRLLREWNIEGGPRAAWNYDGNRTRTELALEGSAELRNYWSADVELGHDLPSDDDRLTRGGPLVRVPARDRAELRVESDSRKAWTLELTGERAWGAAGTSTSFDVELGLKPAPNWSISLTPEWSRERASSQFVTSVADALALGTFGRRYVFADLEQTELSLATDVSVTFTPGLTLQVFARPFVGSGTFGGLKELARRRAFDFARYADVGTIARETGGYVIDPDGTGPAEEFEVDDENFTTRSLRGNAVLRWEWRPGSTLFLVWQQRRESEDASGDLRLRRDLRQLGRARPDNVFVAKVSWWFNP